MKKENNLVSVYLNKVFTVVKAKITNAIMRDESEDDYLRVKCNLKKYLQSTRSKSQNHDSTILNDPEYKNEEIDFQVKNAHMTTPHASHNSSISADTSYQPNTSQPHWKVYPLRQRYPKRVTAEKGARSFIEVTD